MTIIFNYKSITRPDGTKVKTPSIPVELSGKNKIDTVALLDSGADQAAISLEIAEILGLDVTGKKHPAYGIGGKVDSIQSKMRISVGKGHEYYSFLVPVKVILGKYDFGIILGRLGFFSKFVISFDQYKEKVFLKKTSR
ncbi:MAG: hypothetical protein ABH828_06420 [archaeon]